MKPFTSPMNLTCKPAARSPGAGRYEYCVVINTKAAAAPPAGEKWQPLPGFSPDAGDLYHIGGQVDHEQKDADLAGANIGVYYRVKT